MKTAAACLTLATSLRFAVAEPAPRVPEYVHPAAAAESAGVPVGAPPEPRDGGVWYPADAHARIVTMIAAIEPLSTARATRAWSWGYADGLLLGLDECEAERARRVEAEAKAEDAPGIGGYVTAAAAGLAVGVLAAVLAGGVL